MTCSHRETIQAKETSDDQERDEGTEPEGLPPITRGYGSRCAEETRSGVQDEQSQGADVQTGKVSVQDEQGQGADIQTGRVSVQDQQGQGANVQTGKVSV